MRNPNKIKNCIECGVLFTYKTNPSCRCNSCKIKHRKAFIRKYQLYPKCIETTKKYKETRLPFIKEQYKKYGNYRYNLKLRRARRRGYLKNIKHLFTTLEWKDKLEKTSGICPSCNTYIGIEKLTLDHIYPVSKAEVGRIYTINDIQPLCIDCNNRKNAKVINYEHKIRL